MGRAFGCCSQSRVGISCAGRGAPAGQEAVLIRGCVRPILSALGGMSQSAEASLGCLQAKGMDGQLPRTMQVTSSQPPQCPGSARRVLPRSMGMTGRGSGRTLPNAVPGPGMPLKAAPLGVARGAGHVPQGWQHRRPGASTSAQLTPCSAHPSCP